MSKILIIGQAPPLQKQTIPYDTTMLYDWLSEIGISKKEAVEMFDFEAMTDKPPRIGSNGVHLKPSKIEMDDYYRRVLHAKCLKADSIILVGKCSMNYFGFDDFYKTVEIKDKRYTTIIHPSKRNHSRYMSNRDKVLFCLTKAIN